MCIPASQTPSQAIPVSLKRSFPRNDDKTEEDAKGKFSPKQLYHMLQMHGDS